MAILREILSSPIQKPPHIVARKDAEGAKHSSLAALAALREIFFPSIQKLPHVVARKDAEGAKHASLATWRRCAKSFPVDSETAAFRFSR